MGKYENFTQILSELAPFIQEVEESLSANLSTRVELVDIINRYVIGSGGKRLRPILMILTARMCGYKGDNFASLATVIEYLHSATLLHDDVLDGARIRRGNASANLKWGNTATVLAGDFLFSRAFYILVENYNKEITLLMTDTAIRMIEGEVLQLAKKRKTGVTPEDYFQIIGLKTASLISASCKVGAMLAGAKDADIERAASFGTDLGLAFQIVDDTLDFVADPTKFGKTPGNDFKEGTTTMPVIKLLEGIAGPEKDRIEALLQQETATDEEVSWVIGLIREKGADKKAYGEANLLLDKALRHLEGFSDGPYRAMLGAAADYVTARQV